MEQVKNKTIKKKIMIKPKYINDEQYILQKLKDMEKTCTEYGYIQEVVSVSKLEFYKFYEQSFSGSIILNVYFNTNIVTVENNEIVKCKIVKSDEDGIIAESTYPIIIIIQGDYEDLAFLDIDDIIDVKIIKWEISRERNIIKAIGKYIP